MNLTPRVDVAELSDADLEQISGGNAGAGASAGLVAGLSADLVGPLTGEVCASVQGALSSEGAVLGGHAGVRTTAL